MAKKRTSKLDLLTKMGGTSSVKDLYNAKKIEEKEEGLETFEKDLPVAPKNKTVKKVVVLNKLEKELVKYKESSDASNRETKSISIDIDVAMDVEDFLSKLKRKGHNLGFSLTVEALCRRMLDEVEKIG